MYVGISQVFDIANKNMFHQLILTYNYVTYVKQAKLFLAINKDLMELQRNSF